MDYEKIFLDWKTRRTFENEMPESSADSKNDTTKCAGMSDTSERNGSKLSTLCELTIEAGELEKALLDKVYGQEDVYKRQRHTDIFTVLFRNNSG